MTHMPLDFFKKGKDTCFHPLWLARLFWFLLPPLLRVPVGSVSGSQATAGRPASPLSLERLARHCGERGPEGSHPCHSPTISSSDSSLQNGVIFFCARA